ncbi:MAG: 7 transmembrane receptor [Candidatus Thiodiazotropha sp.]
MDETAFKTLCGLILSLMICFGVVGNSISFLTWMKGKRCRHLPGSTYLSALAVSDNLILCTSGVKYAIELLFTINLWNLNEGACKLLHTTWHLFFLMSTWIVVSLTIERTIAVVQPLKRAIRTSKKRELLMVLFYFVAFLLINLPFTVGAKMLESSILSEWNDDSTTYTNATFDLSLNVNVSNSGAPQSEVTAVKTCQADPDSFYFKYEDEYHNWFIDFVLLFSAPVLILTVCNVMILVTLCRQKTPLEGTESRQYGKSSRSVSGPLTARVIALSAVQCISVGPFSVAALIPGVLPNVQAVDTIQFIDRMFIIMALIWYLNNCVNFVLYSLFGKAFRQDCIDVLCGQSGRRGLGDTSNSLHDSGKHSKSDHTLSESSMNKKY